MPRTTNKFFTNGIEHTRQAIILVCSKHNLSLHFFAISHNQQQLYPILTIKSAIYFLRL